MLGAGLSVPETSARKPGTDIEPPSEDGDEWQRSGGTGGWLRSGGTGSWLRSGS